MKTDEFTDGPTYRVHLRTDADTDLESPLETDRIDFFDAGVWVYRPGERLFVPYHQIAHISEDRPEGEEGDPASQ